MLMNIATVIATVLGFIFPAVLIDAIRSDDEDKAYSDREKACVIFWRDSLYYTADCKLLSTSLKGRPRKPQGETAINMKLGNVPVILPVILIAIFLRLCSATKRMPFGCSVMASAVAGVVLRLILGRCPGRGGFPGRGSVKYCPHRGKNRR